MDIEITGYRALYSKSIASRGIARFISWLGTAGAVDCFNKSMYDCYIRVYDLYGRVQLNLVGPTLGYAPKMSTQLIIRFYLHDYARQLEYSKQYSISLVIDSRLSMVWHTQPFYMCLSKMRLFYFFERCI